MEIIQGMDGKLFHEGKSTKIVSLRGKGLKKVTEFLTKSSLEPGNIIIHCGSNDLTKGLVEEVNDQSEELINVAKKKYKDCKIYISMPICRTGNSWFNRITDECVTSLKELCRREKVTYMFHNNINSEMDNYRGNRIHLSE